MKKKNIAINFVAEVGCNHQGSMKLAMKMIDVLVNFCDVKFVKFQKRNPIELLGEKKYNLPHPVPSNSLVLLMVCIEKNWNLILINIRKFNLIVRKKN